MSYIIEAEKHNPDILLVRENAGAWVDEVAGNNAALSGGASLLTAGGPGADLETYLELSGPGTSDEASVPHFAGIEDIQGGNATFFMFLRIPANFGTSDNWASIFRFGAVGYGLQRYSGSTTETLVTLGDANSSNFILTQGEWIGVAIVRDQAAGTVTVYMRDQTNGAFAQVISESLAWGSETSDSLVFGNRSGSTTYAEVDVAGYFSTTDLLTTSEMNSLWTAAQTPIAGTVKVDGAAVENARVKIFTESSLEDQTAPTFVETVLTDVNGYWSMQTAYNETLSYWAHYKYFKVAYSGTATGGTTTSLTDTGAFTAGEFDDGQAVIIITGGTNAGEERRITGNANTDTINIDGSFPVAIDNTSTYEIGYMYSDEAKFKPPKS